MTIAANLIDGDSIARYRDTGEKDAYYEEVRHMLLTMKQMHGFDYFYVVIPYDDMQYYIWDAGEEGETGVCDLGDTDEYFDNGKEVMQNAFRVSEEKVILITNSKKYGYLASAYVPILDSNGQPVALSSVDISMEKINRRIRQFILIILGVIIGVLSLCQFIYYEYMNKYLVKPLRTLHRAVSELVSENMENLKHFHVDIHTQDEIESIADAFGGMTKELDNYITNLANVTKEKERIGTELELATKIQANVLPNIFPAFPERSEFDIYASMTPAKEVGGDFYDFFMMMSKILVSNYASIGGTPAEVLTRVNNQICKNNEEDMFVTVWFGILTISTGHVIASNAGHEYPMLRSANGDFTLFKDKHGFVVGGFAIVSFFLKMVPVLPVDISFFLGVPAIVYVIAKLGISAAGVGVQGAFKK